VTDAIVGLLRAEGAERRRHARGRTLLDHLCGTAAVIRRWGQPDWLEHAALIHSVYGTDTYHEQLIDVSRRAELAAIAGERAERLAYLFCVTPRRPLFAGTYRWARDLPTRAPARGFDPGDVAPATRDELDAVVLLHMANLADQACQTDGSPGRWLARVRDLGELIVDSLTVSVPSCVGRLVDLSEDDEVLAAQAYAQAVTADGEARASGLALAATACPAVAEPCVWLAYLARCRGDAASSAEWVAQARARLLSLGTAWDKRLTFAEWLAVINGLQRAPVDASSPEAADPRGLRDAVAWAAAGPGSDSAVEPAPTVRAADDAAGRRRFQRYVEGLADVRATGSGGMYPDLASRPWHDPSEFPLAGYLESHFPAIRAEILALDGVRFQRESERIGRTGNWEVAFLYERGRRRDDVCDACPVTAASVEGHRTLRTAAGLIYVSRMRAGTHISPHRGPTNLRLRCHLAIAVPDGDCAIRVGDRTQAWQEGRCLVFDDCYEHEAWNHTAQDRIVLIIDLWHPGLSDAEVALLEGLHAHTYRQARRLSRYWAANAAARGADDPAA